MLTERMAGRQRASRDLMSFGDFTVHVLALPFIKRYTTCSLVHPKRFGGVCGHYCVCFKLHFALMFAICCDVRYTHEHCTAAKDWGNSRVSDHNMGRASLYLSSLNPGDGRVVPKSESTMCTAGLPPAPAPMTPAMAVRAFSSSL